MWSQNSGRNRGGGGTSKTFTGGLGDQTLLITTLRSSRKVAVSLFHCSDILQWLTKSKDGYNCWQLGGGTEFFTSMDLQEKNANFSFKHLWWKWYSHFGTVNQFLRKWNMKLPYNSEIAPLDIYPKERKTCIYIKICPPTFMVALFLIAQTWKQPKCLQ